MKNNDIKINFTNSTITLSAVVDNKARIHGSVEYEKLKEIMAELPGFTIHRNTHRSPKTCNPDKGLTYANMERYMSVFKNATELQERFEEVKELSAVQTNRYKYVRSWFISQFPDYKNLPDFISINQGNITIFPAPVIDDNEQAVS